MATRQVYTCDCGDAECACATTPINDHAAPVMIYIVAGHVNGGGEIGVSGVDPWIRALLERTPARIELHAHCATHYLRRMLAMAEATDGHE